MLRFTPKEAKKTTPYQILTLFKYHREYNKEQFGGDIPDSQKRGHMDDIDKALGGF